MDFIKKNYEKVLLALVLLGLTGAVASLPIIISQKKEELAQVLTQKTNTPAKPLPPLKTEIFDNILKRVDSPLKLDFTTKHNLLNPVLWQIMPGGALVKVETGKELGAGALEVTAIQNLNLTVTYESSDPTGYFIKVTDQNPKRKQDTTRTTVVSLGSTNSFLVLTKVGGSPDRPELELRFKDGGESFTVSQEKSYSRVSGHLASFKYPPDPTTPAMNDKRTNDTIRFGGIDYIIIDIADSSVVIMDKSTGKKTTISFSPSK